MIVPLYDHENHEKNPVVKFPNGGNTGLWYNKFFRNWNEEWKIKDNGKINWLKDVVWEGNKNKRIRKRKIGKPQLIKEYINRINYLVNTLGGETRVYFTNWHMAIGLGLSHPIENGMTWHHNLGIPYIPGSSLKGIIRTWAEQWSCTARENIDSIYGHFHYRNENNDDKKGTGDDEAVGTIIFFDALPVEPVELAADIMTPHYQEYYSKTGKLPGDWYDPKPIPFLTVGASQLFMFAVAPRKKDYISDMDLVLGWLDEALTTIGAGAKTATGYGRFTRQT